MNSLELQHQAELLRSAIAPAVIELNFESLDGEQSAEALLYKASRRNDGRVSDKYTHYQNLGAGWWCAGLDLATNARMDWGCFKPDKPRVDNVKGKPIKYEHPPATNTEYFALALTFELGAKIADRYGLAEIYAIRQGENPESDEDRGFWPWVLEQKDIPLMITEGVKKAACLLSIGYLAIGLPGIWGAHRSNKSEGLPPALIPGLRSIVKGREMLFVFDQDSNPDTAREVGKAANTTAKDCRKAGAVATGRIAWDLFDHPHKGVDDLVANEGAEVFDRLVAEFSDRKAAETTTETNSEKEEKETIADKARKIAESRCEFFHTPEKAAYADIIIDGCRHTYPLRSRQFKLWLTGEYLAQHDKGINSQAMQDCLTALESIAIFRNPEKLVHLRTAEIDGKIYIDLGAEDWQAIEVDTLGWRLVSAPPVRFWRPESLLPMPIPTTTGKLEDLRELLNVDGDSWALIVTFLLFCYYPSETYPVLVLSAVRGSGKSAAAEILKGLVDPGKGGLLQLPTNARDLAVNAQRRNLLVYDNVSYISPEVSDLVCRMATNFSHGVRTLFSNEEETTFEMTRPQIITAIDAIVTRDDLADRVLMTQLGAITEEKRLPQKELKAKIDKASPGIFGALLTALSSAIAKLPEARAKAASFPRMADYALFAMAAEEAIGLADGEFMQIFNRSREESRQVVLDASPIAGAIIALVNRELVWKGTPTELLSKLEQYAEPAILKSRFWPAAANSLSSKLNRLKPDLEAAGVSIKDFREGKAGTKAIIVEKSLENVFRDDHPQIETSGKTSSVSSAKDFSTLEPLQDKGSKADDLADDRLTIPSLTDDATKCRADDTTKADDRLTIPEGAIVSRETPAKSDIQATADDTDDVFPQFSSAGKEVLEVDWDE